LPADTIVVEAPPQDAYGKASTTACAGAAHDSAGILEQLL